MHYCTQFNRNIRHIEKFDEIIVNYDNNEKELMNYLKKYLDKRFIIKIEVDKINEIILNFFSELQKDNSNFSLCLNTFNKDIIKKIEEKNIPYFLNAYIKDWDTLIGILQYKVTDVYITENLCFDIKRVSAIAKKHNIKIRVFPNIAQSAWNDINSIIKFFIRPEDTYLYEPYVDTFEFIGKPNQMETYLKIYKEDQKWFGPLKEIIIDFNNDLDNKYVVPHFGERRLSCNKECLKGEKCKMCFTIEELAKALEKAKLAVTINNKEEK